MLPDTSFLEALDVAERLRKMIASSAVDVAGNRIQFTASLGVSERTAGTPSVERLLETANVAMYDTKGSGRNRVAGFLGAGLRIAEPASPLLVA
jgi:diguanylate cyclase (GGDEF)-like protein